MSIKIETDGAHLGLTNGIVAVLGAVTLLAAVALYLIGRQPLAFSVIAGSAVAVFNVYLSAFFVSGLFAVIVSLVTGRREGTAIKSGSIALMVIAYVFRFVILMATVYLLVKLPGIDVLGALIALAIAHTAFMMATVGVTYLKADLNKEGVR